MILREKQSRKEISIRFLELPIRLKEKEESGKL
jgi:hypothetical protein